MNDPERRFLALAIQGLVLRHSSPHLVDLGISVTKKLGLEDLLEEYLKSWVAQSEAVKAKADAPTSD